jgi:hypothetical protein
MTTAAAPIISIPVPVTNTTTTPIDEDISEAIPCIPLPPVVLAMPCQGQLDRCIVVVEEPEDSTSRTDTDSDEADDLPRNIKRAKRQL